MSDLTPETIAELKRVAERISDVPFTSTPNTVVGRVFAALPDLLAAAEERDRMRAVVEAAKAFRGAMCGEYHQDMADQYLTRQERCLADALDAALSALGAK